MNKLQMAHEYAIALINSDCEMQFDKFIRLCWNYADAMQAEADKREKEESEKKRADIREMLKANNTFVEPEGQHFDDVEWQPDWSQAPSWANWWAVDLDLAQAHWYGAEPTINTITWRRRTRTCKQAPSFNYQGNWQDSLRKRP